jgi:hypothetical protein
MLKLFIKGDVYVGEKVEPSLNLYVQRLINYQNIVQDNKD